jgi:gamma-glutamyl:cysteine ligase YbdK (ATP-grasp superfamily)
VADRVLPQARSELGDRAQPELYRSQVEMNTPVCATLGEVRDAVRRSRRALAEPPSGRGCGSPPPPPTGSRTGGTRR